MKRYRIFDGKQYEPFDIAAIQCQDARNMAEMIRDNGLHARITPDWSRDIATIYVRKGETRKARELF
jgi:hypothetical protein